MEHKLTLDSSFFIIPVAHFPWSVKAMKEKGQLDADGNKMA